MIWVATYLQFLIVYIYHGGKKACAYFVVLVHNLCCVCIQKNNNKDPNIKIYNEKFLMKDDFLVIITVFLYWYIDGK